MTVLRAELLEGHGVALAGPAGEGIASRMRELGARVESLAEADLSGEDDVGGWARARLPLRVLVYDARASFGDGGPNALTDTLQQAWLTVREVAVGALIDGTEPGKVILIGPEPDAGPQAQAVGAALENLVRTLSVEWARYGVTTVMVAPRPGLEESRLAELVGFLCSAGADYVSGSRLELG
jgi:NAD(P)-dependent dehydrogenase (short-subunit alcohol dehydrogenase family)